MSTLKVNNLQVGQDATATNNFTLYQPSTPNGTVRLGVGNVGSVTDVLTISSIGRLGIGTTSPDAGIHTHGLEIRSSNTAKTNLTILGIDGQIELVRSDSAAYIDFKTDNTEDYDCRIQQSSNGLQFQTGGNGSTGIRCTITSGGDLNIANGNLVIGTSGKGIDFSAAGNAAGMTSEILNDYEIGTWNPQLGGTGNSFSQSVVTARYTKIGNIVCAAFQITWSARSGTGDVTISLPFTVTSTGTYRGGGSLGMLTNSNLMTASKIVFLQVDGSFTFANLRYSNNNATWSPFLASDAGTSGEIQGTICYHTDS